MQSVLISLQNRAFAAFCHVYTFQCLQVVCKKVFASWYCSSLWIYFHLGWRFGSWALRWREVSFSFFKHGFFFFTHQSWFLVLILPFMFFTHSLLPYSPIDALCDLPGIFSWLRNMVWRSLNLVLSPIMDWHGRWQRGEVTEKFTSTLSPLIHWLKSSCSYKCAMCWKLISAFLYVWVDKQGYRRKTRLV